MKREEIDPKQTGCCGGAVIQDETGCCGGADIQDETGCCGGADMQDETGCCGGADMQDETGCCGGADMQDETGCCKHPHEAKAPNIDQEKQLESQSETASIDELKRTLAATNDKYIRLYSEFDNFKKRIAKERMALTDKANEQTLKELLPIIDDFERCITALQEEHEVVQQATQAGIKLIYDKLTTFLQRFNVIAMNLEPGSPFNADLHEAIMQQPVEAPEMKGKIISIVEKGYLLHSYVLRFAKVVIGI